MKRLILILTGIIVFTCSSAQSLEEIVKKYSIANKQDRIAGIKTVKITAKMSMMGMEMPMTMYMKNPNKIKTVTSFSGQEMISVFDGVKGYTLNPMTGSTVPVEMTADQIKQTQNSNVFHNYMANFLKEGKLSLAGEDKVNEKSAFKLRANLGDGNAMDMLIDKTTYLLVKTSISVKSGGTAITIDSYPSDYKETSGILLPMKTTSSAQGMEFIITFTNIEVDIPMEDSVFKIN